MTTTTDIDNRRLWNILKDVVNSFDLAMREAQISLEQRANVLVPVLDYLANQYGDD